MFMFRGQMTVEVPLNISRASVFFSPEEESVPESEMYENAVYRLLAVEYQGEILYSVAAYIADRNYLDSLPGVLDDLSLRDMQGFSGRVMYYTISGEFLGGIIARDGQAHYSVSADESESDQPWPFLLRATSRSQECEFEIVTKQNCFLIDIISESGINSGKWECYDFTTIQLVCREGPKANYFDQNPQGGGNNTDPDAPGLPLVDTTKKSLNTDLLTEEQKKIVDSMKNKIWSDCMGKELLRILNQSGNTYTIVYDPTKSSQFDSSTNTISLEYLWSRLLLHELIHAYQRTKATSWSYYNNTELNREIEARYAEYVFVQRDAREKHKWGSYYRESPVGSAVSYLDVVVSRNGEYTPGVAEIDRSQMDMVADALRNMGYKDLIYDDISSPGLTFQHIKELSKNCPK